MICNIVAIFVKLNFLTMIYKVEVDAQEVKFSEEAKEAAKNRQVGHAYGAVVTYSKGEDKFFVIANINSEATRLEEGMWIVDFGNSKKVLTKEQAEKHLDIPVAEAEVSEGQAVEVAESEVPAVEPEGDNQIH